MYLKVFPGDGLGLGHGGHRPEQTPTEQINEWTDGCSSWNMKLQIVKKVKSKELKDTLRTQWCSRHTAA